MIDDEKAYKLHS